MSNRWIAKWQSFATRKYTTKLLNVSVAASLLLGSLPIAVVSAAPLPLTTVGCQPTASGSQIFLPFVSSTSAGSNLNASSSPESAQLVERQLRYRVGSTYVYEWNLAVNTKTIAHDSEGTHDQGAATTVIRALAEVAITGKDSAGIFAGRVELRDPFVCNSDGKTDSVMDNADLIEALKTPITFKQASNGVVTAVSQPPNALPEVTNLQKGVINALQMTLQPGADQYEVEEKGGQGSYKASYSLKEEDNSLHISKSYDQSDFSKMVTGGDESKTLTVKTTSTIVLDGAQGVPTSMESTDEIATGTDSEAANAPEGNYAGATVWSKATSISTFTLKEVKPTPLTAASLPLQSYIEGDLGTIIPESPKNRQGIDLAEVDLNSEFATLEAAPEEPEHFARILDLVDADPATVVVGQIKSHLQSNASNEAVAKLYIDLLAAIGTPYAQEILSSVLGNPTLQAADLSATLSISVQEQAMIDLLLVSSPTITTVNTVKGVAQNNQSALQETAVAVLGGTIGNLADEDSATAELLAGELVQSLSAVTETNQVQLYLDAIGNTGLPTMLETITSYLTGTVQSAGSSNEIVIDPEIQSTALMALRKIPGQAAEDILVAALSNTNETEALRMTVANALATRPSLSPPAASALQGYLSANLASPGLYRRYWNSTLGGSKLGVEFPGGLTVASPPSYYLYLYAYQQANGMIWGRRFNIAQGELLARGQGSTVLLGAYLSIANNRIRKQFQQTLSCNVSRQGTLWQGSSTFLDTRLSIPVAYVITVDFAARVQGSASLDYNLTANVCSQTNSSASASITPRAWATATGSGSSHLVFVRGGVGISATLLNTQLPVKVTATYSGANFRFCGDIRVITQPLSGRIYGFADAGIQLLFIKLWKRVFTGTIWSFSTPSYQYPLWSSCL